MLLGTPHMMREQMRAIATLGTNSALPYATASVKTIVVQPTASRIALIRLAVVSRATITDAMR
jgi:hypothetical protein